MQFLVKSVRNVPFGKPRRRWEENMKTDFKEMIFEDVGWIHLAENRNSWWTAVSTIMSL
jgi:hypothetical protein